MKIECTIKRPGGSHVDIERDKYHFAPQEDGAHVAEVEKKTHIGILLAIREAYQIYDGGQGTQASSAELLELLADSAGSAALGMAPPPDQSPEKQGVAPDILLGSNDHPASFDIAGKTYSLSDIVNMAFEASGLTLAEWNAQSDDNRASQIDEQLDALEVKPEADDMTQKLAEMQEATERAGLIEQYTTMFGKAPKASMKNDTLRAKIAAGV